MLALPSRSGPWPKNTGIGTDHWKPLGLKAWLEVATANLAFILPAHHSAAVSHEPHLSTIQARWWPEAQCSPISVPRSVSIRCWDAARARFWDFAVRGCSAWQLAIRRRLLQEGWVSFWANPRLQCIGICKSSMTRSMRGNYSDWERGAVFL